MYAIRINSDGPSLRAIGAIGEARVSYVSDRHPAGRYADPWGSAAKPFMRGLDRGLSDKGDDLRSGSYLFQTLSVAVQCGNGAKLMETFRQS
ncbi:hypothetical protein EVAR_94783_1 [Eumeta japonica]|uniref:Uncharacterized protein n=1 Tax=Eumeta variegata TaxID=151549 RepID=A0A4C1UIJ9_EUMVA|nr:hypothetical protein EVAR_94783_1 [Eumeta japonica]